MPLGPPVVPTVGRSTSPFVSDVAEVGPVVWATKVEPGTNAPRLPVEAFPADAPVIYAVLPVVRLERGAELSATWSYNGTLLPTFRSTVVAADTQAGGWIEFHIARAGGEPWPEGIYAVTVSVGGQIAQTAAVPVEAPGSA